MATNGGRRPGAGRPAGSVTAKTRAIAEQRIADGKATPLEVMLANMDFYHSEADKALEQLLVNLDGSAPAAPAEPAAEGEGQDPRRSAIDALRNILGLRAAAQDAAKDAAPFMHARINAIDAGAGEEDNDHVPLAERLKRYAQDEAIAASEGKVVSMKGKT